MVPRSSDRISRVPPYLIRPIGLPIRGCHPLWPDFPVCSGHPQGSAGPRSLATTNGVSVDVLSSGYLDVSVPRVCFLNPMYSGPRYLVCPIVDCLAANNNQASGGFPHSEIHGSKPIPGSPWLIAGYHVLHRLLLPRHPPNALIALDLIRKKKDFAVLRAASFCSPRRSLPIKSMYVSRPFHAEGTFCAGPMQDRRIWLVYLTWTTSLLLSDPEGSYRHRIHTRIRPITLIISLNDVK